MFLLISRKYFNFNFVRFNQHILQPKPVHTRTTADPAPRESAEACRVPVPARTTCLEDQNVSPDQVVTTTRSKLQPKPVPVAEPHTGTTAHPEPRESAEACRVPVPARTTCPEDQNVSPDQVVTTTRSKLQPKPVPVAEDKHRTNLSASMTSADTSILIALCHIAITISPASFLIFTHHPLVESRIYYFFSKLKVCQLP